MGIDDRGRPLLSTPSTQPSALVSVGREFDPEAETQNGESRLEMAKSRTDDVIFPVRGPNLGLPSSFGMTSSREVKDANVCLMWNAHSIPASAVISDPIYDPFHHCREFFSHQAAQQYPDSISEEE